uniref:Uncharacterized protein n=1 Tax=Meloidogyne enterolobii TaxID=390850 RepID=A0A6V7UTQ7_MELEN|nr:unnamed protein product [Meloidogyne enterolobii]
MLQINSQFLLLHFNFILPIIIAIIGIFGNLLVLLTILRSTSLRKLVFTIPPSDISTSYQNYQPFKTWIRVSII